MNSKSLLVALGRMIGGLIGGIVAVVAMVVAFVGVGLAVGRAVDLLQGAQPRLLTEWTVALDGWAILFTAYVLIWLPLSAVVRTVRAPPVELQIDD